MVSRSPTATQRPSSFAKQPVVDEHRDHLLDEQRIAFRHIGNAIPDVQCGLGLTEQLRDQTVAGRLVQRLELARGASTGALAPVRMPLEELRPADAEQENRNGRRVARHVLEQREERRLGPLGVVEHGDEWAGVCQSREKRSDGPETLLNCSSRFQKPRELGDRLGDSARIFMRREQRLQLRHCVIRTVALADATCLLNHLRKRPERDPLAIGKAAPAEDRRPLTETGEELVSEPRLADPGCTDDRNEAAALLRDASLERPLELGKGVLAADEGSLQPRCWFRHRRDADQSVRGDRILLPFQPHRRHELGFDRPAHEPERRLPEQDLAWLGALLQTGRNVRRVARHEVALGEVALSSDLACIDPGPRRQDDPVALLEVLVQTRQRLSHLDSGSDGAQCVVLVELRQAVHRHDGIAYELGERAAVSLDDRFDALEVVRQDVRERFWVEPLAQTCRVDDVGEEDRDGLAEPL